jgi:uncharacterized FlaG/YvyC family protein
MESGGAVTVVSSKAETKSSVSSPGAISSKPVRSDSANFPQPAPVASDAVAVELSSNEIGSRENTTSEKADPKSSGIPLQEAKELATRFESAVNSTQVKFKVSLEERGNNVINFQVIDRETGQVIRQFPAEELKEKEQKLAQAGDGSGLLFDSAV